MAKGDIYEYEGKQYTLTGRDFTNYHLKTKVDLEKIYTPEESTEIMNNNAVACYKGIFTCLLPLSGERICEMLSDIKEELDIRIDAMCGEEDTSTPPERSDEDEDIATNQRSQC